jgi:16S rRNA C1402 N4-methylase RsmH
MTPLDMRMDLTQSLSAATGQRLPQDCLANVIRELGEERRPARSRAITKRRPIETTPSSSADQGRDPAVGALGRGHPAKRTFQVIRSPSTAS